jgi:hypothetical protein
MQAYRLVVATLALAALSAPCLGQNNVYAVNFSGDLFRIGNSSGAGALVGDTTLSSLNSLVVWHGLLYTIDPTGRLYRIDPSDASVVAGVQYSFGGKSDVRALCADAREEVWAVVDGGGHNQDELWRIPASGQPVFVGQMGRSSIQGLVITANDRMFAWDVNPAASGGLVTVNRLTGATADVSLVIGGSDVIQELYAFGTAVRGIRDSLFSLNTTTGERTLVGSGGYSDVRGATMMSFFMQPQSALKFGRQVSGNDLSLTRFDGDTLDIQKFIVPNRFVDPITVEYSALLPVNVAKADVLNTRTVFIGKMNVAGSFQVSIDVLNTDTNTFTNLSSGPITTTPVELALAASGASHVSAAGLATWRVRVKPAGPVAAALYTLQTDYFGMQFTLKD